MNKHVRQLLSLALTAAMTLSLAGAAKAGAAKAEAVETTRGNDAIWDAGIESVFGGTEPRTSTVPSYQEVFNTMTALKAQYPEGMTWTNFTPYGRDGNLGDTYWFQGGKVHGASGGVGCAAFAFILSDAAFGALPARTLDVFAYSDVKPGDILRVENNSHFVIVLQKSAAGITVAEANYNKSVHWGRAMSEAEVMCADFLVTRYPAGYVDPSEGNADEVVQSGTEGGLDWELTQGGTLTITGTGAIPDHTASERPPWDAYSGQINAVTIGSGITGIGEYAFYRSPALSVYLPDTLTEIGTGAFYESNLIAVTIPGSVQTIGDSAFYHCQSLKSASISEGVRVIGNKSFSTCALEYIDFPSTVTEIGSGAFMDCQSLLRVRFAPGDATVSIGSSLFSGCWYLADVVLPLQADRVSGGMFASCYSLTELYIPAGIESIDGAGSPDGVPFTNCSRLAVINFGGSSSEWTEKGGASALLYSGLANKTTVNFNVPFDDPFADISGDPGDLVVDPDDPAHEHNWSDIWSSNDTHHWHTCSADGCPATDVSQMDGYAEHSYGDWVTDVEPDASQPGSRHRGCTVCGYRQTESIPATDDPSDGPDNGGDPSVPDDGPGGTTPWPSVPTTPVPSPQPGSQTEPAEEPDDSSAVVITQEDGTVVSTTIDASGGVEIEVQLSETAVNAAGAAGQPVPLPVSAVEPVRDAAKAPAITVYTENNEPVTVAVPVISPTAGTVAVAVNADGSTSVVKTSVLAGDSIVVPLASGATIKIIDNAKRFSDVAAGSWAEEAIAFVSARELFGGTTETSFDPESPMTRAMLATVLARLDGADTAGGSPWYAKGVAWAVANGISDGTDPNGCITREQLVTMLWRYLGSPEADDALSGFTDAAQVSGYAQDAMRWAVENGIITGFGDNRLAPGGPAARAQVAQILKNFIEYVTLDFA